MLADDSRSTLGIMRKWNVDVLCTSDDLLSDVGVHRKATEKAGTFRVFPSLRGDSILAFGTDANRRLVAGLSETVSADGLDSYLAGISARLDAFGQAGCRLADHALDSGFRFVRTCRERAERIFAGYLADGNIAPDDKVYLAAQGYRVVLVGRTREKLEVTGKSIREKGGTCLILTADVKNLEQMTALREEVRHEFGLCSVLINGAGGNQPDAVTTYNAFDPEELSPENKGRGFFNLDMTRFLDVINVNIMGTVIPCQLFARDMVAAGGGSIVNFASMNTYRPLSRIPAYALSKAGISNFTQWLAAYLAPANIRVNAVAPGFFLNDRSRKMLLDPDSESGYSPRGANIIRQTPMKRFGEARQLLGCVNWLIDDEKADFVTGITVPVDGGFLSDSGL